MEKAALNDSVAGMTTDENGEANRDDSVDASVTEASSPREQRGKKAKGSIDWAPIKRDYVNGVSVSQIAQRHSISENTIYSQARRFRWVKKKPELKGMLETVSPKEIAKKAVEKEVEKAIDEQRPVINSAVREQLNGWFQKILRTSDRLHEQIESAANVRLEVEEIKSLSSSLEVVDRIARRTFGLDSPNSHAVSVFSVSSPTISCPVIDVEALPVAPPVSQSDSVPVATQ